MIGALIGAGASLLGGYLNNKAQAKAAEASNAAAERNAERNIELQKEFAQSGIRWKVEDAQKAGIHPLAALGAQTVSFTPQTVGHTARQPDYSHLASAGQDIGRAIDSTRSASERVQHLQTGILEANLEGARLDNDIKRARIASALATGSAGNPPMASMSGNSDLPGQGNVPAKIKGPQITVETRRDVASGEKPAHVPGHGPSVAYVKNNTGGYTPIIPPEMAESIESDPVGALDWTIRNRMLPNVYSVDPPPIPRQKGQVVVWSTARQQWEVVSKEEAKRYGIQTPPATPFTPPWERWFRK